MEKVRRIRNDFERRGHNPLPFFLKCQEADDARLPELIRDEIKARTFFVLCNTRASRRSKWVKQAIELVKQVTKPPRQIVVVMKLARDLQTELPNLDLLSKRAVAGSSWIRSREKSAVYAPVAICSAFSMAPETSSLKIAFWKMVSVR